MCVFVCAPCLYPAFPGSGVLCGRVCWARVSAVPEPCLLGCWGVRAVVRVPRLPPPFLGGRLWRGGVRVLPLVGFIPPPSLWFLFFLLGGLRKVYSVFSTVFLLLLLLVVAVGCPAAGFG